MGEERLVAAGLPLGEPEEGHGRLALGPPQGLVRDLGQHPLARLHVGPRVEEDAVAREAVASGPTHLLVPRLDIRRHVAVDHEADVRLVDPHAEGDRGDHHLRLVAGERLLVGRALLVGQAGVIRERPHPLLPQEGRGRLHGAARQAVDDPALAGVPPHQGEDLPPGVPLALLSDPDPEVRAKEGSLVAVRLPHSELPHDVQRHPAGGRGGEGEDRKVPELLAEPPQPPVRRTEVVPPV